MDHHLRGFGIRSKGKKVRRQQDYFRNRLSEKRTWDHGEVGQVWKKWKERSKMIHLQARQRASKVSLSLLKNWLFTINLEKAKGCYPSWKKPAFDLAMATDVAEYIPSLMLGTRQHCSQVPTYDTISDVRYLATSVSSGLGAIWLKISKDDIIGVSAVEDWSKHIHTRMIHMQHQSCPLKFCWKILSRINEKSCSLWGQIFLSRQLGLIRSREPVKA